MKKIALFFFFIPLFNFAQNQIPYSVIFRDCRQNYDGTLSESHTIDTMNIYGNLISRTNLSEPDRLTYYYYNTNQLPDSIVSIFYSYNKLFLSWYTKFTYDTNDTLIGEVSWYYQLNDTIRIDSSAHIVSRNFDLSTRILHSESSDYSTSSGWNNFTEYDKTYDILNRLTEHVQYTNFIPSSKQTILYLSNDSISQTFNSIYQSGFPSDTDHAIYIYNQMGLNDTIIGYNWQNNNNSTLKNLRANSYDQNNKLILRTNWSWYAQDSIWYLSNRHEFDYYPTGELKHYNYYRGLYADNYFYQYDPSGKIDSTYHCYWNQGFSICTGCKITESLITTGINLTESSSDLLIFPNPSNEYITIKNLNAELEFNEYTLTDMTGRLILSEQLDKIESQGVSIDISILNSGIYFLSLNNKSNKLITRKIIKL